MSNNEDGFFVKHKTFFWVLVIIFVLASAIVASTLLRGGCQSKPGDSGPVSISDTAITKPLLTSQAVGKGNVKPDTVIQMVPPQYVNNQPDMTILDHSTPEAQSNGVYGLLDREWPTQWINGRLYWFVDCIFFNKAARKGKTDSTHYDLVFFRHLPEYEGFLTSGIYDTLGNLVRPAYKVNFDFSPEPYSPNFSTKDYIELGYMAVNWGCTDEYTDPQDITGLSGAYNFITTINKGGKIFKEQNYNNNTTVYPMWIDSTGVHLRK